MTTEAKFWARVRMGAPAECWEWTGARDSKGYGRISAYTHGANLAHRYALRLATGVRAVPSQVVMHSCDNPPCCNPAHLRLGTSAENAGDAAAKGRLSCGSAHHSAKMSENDVRIARKLYTTGLFTHRSLSEIYGVHAQVIKSALYGKTWKRVPGALVPNTTRNRWGFVNEGLSQ